MRYRRVRILAGRQLPSESYLAILRTKFDWVHCGSRAEVPILLQDASVHLLPRCVARSSCCGNDSLDRLAAFAVLAPANRFGTFRRISGRLPSLRTASRTKTIEGTGDTQDFFWRVAKSLAADFDFGGAAPFAFKGGGFEFLFGSLRSVPQPLSHCLTKLRNSRQLLLSPQLPRVSFE